jgi:antitoxin ParD1/3/4
MHAHKLSISLPQQQFEFIEQYQIERRYGSRSDVIKEALYLLQQAHLEASYKAAADEIDSGLDNTAADGIDDNETW